MIEPLEQIVHLGDGAAAATRDALTPINLTYSMSDVTPPTYGAKRLEIANNISECKASRIFAQTKADFDNVMTNALPSTPVAPVVRPAPIGDVKPTDELVGRVN